MDSKAFMLTVQLKNRRFFFCERKCTRSEGSLLSYDLLTLQVSKAFLYRCLLYNMIGLIITLALCSLVGMTIYANYSTCDPISAAVTYFHWDMLRVQFAIFFFCFLLESHLSGSTPSPVYNGRPAWIPGITRTFGSRANLWESEYCF